MDLAVGNSLATVLAKKLRKRDHGGHLGAEEHTVVGDAIFLRPRAGEHRGPAGITDGVLHVSTLEEHPESGQPIEVGRFRLGIAVTAESATQVIGDDEQNVVTRLSAESLAPD